MTRSSNGRPRLLALLSFAALAFAQLNTLAAQDRPVAPWPPAKGPLRVIIDTDAANEVDDQFAITLAVGFPERLKIEGFVAAHYGQWGGKEGIAKSRASLEETLAKANMSGKFTIKNGSDPIVYKDRISESEGVDFIIETARTATPEDPIWLVLLGPVTDGVVALQKDPSIADRLVVFWHGRSEWPKRCMNFNAKNDPLASRLVFELPCRLVLFDTGTYLTMPMKESATRLGQAGNIGAFLHRIRDESSYARQDSKGIFDLGDIAALIDPEGTSTFEVVEAPSVRENYDYDFSKSHGRIVRIPTIDRDASFKLLDEAIARVSKADP